MRFQNNKEKFLSAKSKASFLAKLFMHKKGITGKIWKLDIYFRISNQLKKYEQNDINVLNKLFEYLDNIDDIPQTDTIWQTILKADKFVLEKNFTQSIKVNDVIDLKKFI